jgi:radical SAM superfamily enzyme YgiQ (UPF0313 family)
MKILFIQTNTNPVLIPLPIGAAMVAQRLRDDGHSLRFVDLMGEKAPPVVAAAAARDVTPDLICFSIRNRDNQAMKGYCDPLPGIRDVVAAVRLAHPAPTLLGGTAFSTFPARMLEYMDATYGIAGDDIDVVSRFVAALAQGRADTETPGLVYRDAMGRIVVNPHSLMGYARTGAGHHDLIDRKRYRRAYWDAAVITRSGCPEQCAYCDTFATFGRTFTLRDPAEIAEELLALKRAGRARSAWLVDAGFNRPLDHAKETLREIIRRGAQLRLYAVFDPGPADREFFQLFRRAGGTGLTMFAESLADPVLEALGKSFGVADVLRDAAALRAERIAFMFMPTLGSPGETLATVAETFRLTPSLGAVFCDFSIGWRVQPDTPLRERAVREGILRDDDDCWDPTFYVSPATPLPWLKGQLRRFRLRHPLMNSGMLPLAIRETFRRPWTWGPEGIVSADVS